LPPRNNGHVSFKQDDWLDVCCQLIATMVEVVLTTLKRFKLLVPVNRVLDFDSLWWIQRLHDLHCSVLPLDCDGVPVVLASFSADNSLVFWLLGLL